MADLPVALRDVRDRVIARLSESFARDELDLEEFDRRVTVAHRAASAAEIEALLADLPIPADKALVPAPKPKAQPVVPATQVRGSQFIVAIMGGSNRRGQWTAPRKLRVLAVMGGSELDFREARLPAGVTTVTVFACMGGVQIIVPPELAVETSGIAIMGGFEHMERAPVEVDPERPVLRIHGMAIMGGVHVETRLAGESGWAASRRRRKERKELAKAQQRQLRERNDR